MCVFLIYSEKDYLPADLLTSGYNRLWWVENKLFRKRSSRVFSLLESFAWQIMFYIIPVSSGLQLLDWASSLQGSLLSRLPLLKCWRIGPMLVNQEVHGKKLFSFCLNTFFPVIGSGNSKWRWKNWMVECILHGVSILWFC